jgi:hypothetical protein
VLRRPHCGRAQISSGGEALGIRQYGARFMILLCASRSFLCCVYAVTDGGGWAPLCNFLGLPVPSVPFPRENDTAEFQSRLGKVYFAVLVACISLGSVLTSSSLCVCIGTGEHYGLVAGVADAGHSAGDGSRDTAAVADGQGVPASRPVRAHLPHPHHQRGE